MINALLNYALQTIMWLAAIWLLLALLSLKWRFFRTARQGYGGLLRTLAVTFAGWLWAPEMERQGGGHLAQAGRDLEEKENEDQWKDSGPEDLP